MAVTITATLLATADPKPVQIVLNGITAGLAYTVTGVAAGSSWVPSGGSGVSTGAQVVLSDSRTPLNAPLTYSVVVSGVTYSAAPVTVTYAAADVVLQSLSGTVVAGVDLVSAQDPRSGVARTTLYQVAGRRNPATRYDLAGSNVWQWAIEADGVDADALETILASGAPFVRRTVLGLRDLDPIQIVQPTDWSSELIGAVGTMRTWSVTVREVDDPQPSRITAAFTWASFDTAMLNRSWSNLVTNPTFDANTTGWAAAGSATLAWQSTGGSTSPGFARLTATSTTAISVNASATFAVTAGDLFAAQAMLRGTVGRFAHIRLTWTGASATQATAVALTSATVWQQYTYTGTVPVGATAVRVDLLMDATIAAGNVLDVDAVQYTPGTNTIRPFPQDFDALFAGLTWDQFDSTDWSTLA